jgi:hypothetical protein
MSTCSKRPYQGPQASTPATDSHHGDCGVMDAAGEAPGRRPFLTTLAATAAGVSDFAVRPRRERRPKEQWRTDAVGAGWEAALIERPGNWLLDALPQPQISGKDLDDVATKLIARHAPTAH